MRLITPLRELNRVPGAPEIGPLRRGLLRRQAGIPQGRHQGAGRAGTWVWGEQAFGYLIDGYTLWIYTS